MRVYRTKLKMAQAIITVKLMMANPDISLEKVEEEVKEVLEKNKARFGNSEHIPIAFGLKALKIKFFADEELGSEFFVEELEKIESVSNVEVMDFRRALG